MIYLIGIYLIMSLITFVSYGIDKRAARKGTRRTRERTLHLMAVAGGWPGAFLGQRTFRHKTIKQPFRKIFWLTLTPPLLLLILVGYLSWA